MFLEEGNVKVIIRPFSKVVKACIEEAIQDNKQNGKISFVETREDNKKQIHGGIID